VVGSPKRKTAKIRSLSLTSLVTSLKYKRLTVVKIVFCHCQIKKKLPLMVNYYSFFFPSDSIMEFLTLAFSSWEAFGFEISRWQERCWDEVIIQKSTN
jgi:hypothetical protein